MPNSVWNPQIYAVLGLNANLLSGLSLENVACLQLAPIHLVLESPLSQSHGQVPRKQHSDVHENENENEKYNTTKL